MKPCNEKMIRLDVVAFLATLQLIIPDNHNADKIKGFGSGFLLRHKEHLFFITALLKNKDFIYNFYFFSLILLKKKVTKK